MQKYRPMLGGYIASVLVKPPPVALVRHIDPAQVRRMLWPYAVRAAANMAAENLKYDDEPQTGSA